MNGSDAQRDFMRGQIHSMVLMATVQRADIYETTSPETERGRFREGLRDALDACALLYDKPVSDGAHLEQIVGLAAISATSVRVDWPR